MFEPFAALDALAAHSVRYVVVGGWAASRHGAARLTDDLDICPELSPENLDRLGESLTELNAQLSIGPGQPPVPVPIIDGRLLSLVETTLWETSAGRLDVLHRIRVSDSQSLTYRELSERQRHVLVNGRHFAIASLRDIVASKQYAGRAKDIEALSELQQLLDRGPEFDL